MQALLVLNLIAPFVMVLVGVLLKKHPQSDMSKQNGYNTPTARKSQAHWDYAQSIAPQIYISLGSYLFLVEIAASIVMLVLKVPVGSSIAVGTLIGLAFMIYGFYYTDKKIKKNFTGK